MQGSNLYVNVNLKPQKELKLHTLVTAKESRRQKTFTSQVVSIGKRDCYNFHSPLLEFASYQTIMVH